jgi:hypothetical protein
MEAVREMAGAFWPYLVVIVIGFLPTVIWRVAGVLAGRNLDENAEIMVWVRLVATALVAGVVAKLILSPSGALAFVPFWARAGAMVVGLTVFFAWRRSVLGGLAAGMLALVMASLLSPPGPP